MQGHNAGNAMIESESILASRCVATRVNATRGVASFCEPALNIEIFEVSSGVIDRTWVWLITM